MSTKVEFKESFVVVPLGNLFGVFNRAIHYEEVQSNLCHIKIEINYQHSELKIFFTNQYDYQELNDAQINFTTELFSIGDKNITIINTIESACSEDQCEREIFQHHSQWLLKIDYHDLQLNLKSWIERTDNKSEKCNVNEVEKCTKYECEIMANPDKKLFYVKPICSEKDRMKSNSLLISYNIHNYLITQYVHFLFDCQRNQCSTYADLLALAILIDTYHDVDDLFIIAGVFQRLDDSEETMIEQEDLFDFLKSSIEPSTTTEVLTNFTDSNMKINQTEKQSPITTLASITQPPHREQTTITNTANHSPMFTRIIIHSLVSVVSSLNLNMS